MPLPWLIGAAAVVIGGAVVAALSDDDSSSTSSSSDDRSYEYELEQQRREERLETIQENLRNMNLKILIRNFLILMGCNLFQSITREILAVMYLMR